MDWSARTSAFVIAMSLVSSASSAFADGESAPQNPAQEASQSLPEPPILPAPPAPPPPNIAPVVAPPPRTETPVQSARRPRYGFVWAGLAVFGAFYLPTAFAGAAESDRCKSHGCVSPGWPLYIPIAGPFIKAPSVPTDLERFGLVFAGLSQAAGAAMIIGGLLAQQTVYFYSPRATVSVAPVMSSGSAGAMVSGRF